jgi:hypothetical protein
MFNYYKTGFVKQPVDFYSRPLWFAAIEYAGVSLECYRRMWLLLSLTLLLLILQSFQRSNIECLGYLRNDEMIMNYLEAALDAGTARRTPSFTISWSTKTSHDDINGISLVDDTYANFLNRIIEKGYLNNTVLILMGDHGYRFGKYRETRIGYYEDRLPNMWITLPPVIQKRFPRWQRSLEINSK